MRQREQTRVAAGQSNEGDVAGRHAIGADAGWYRYLWKSEPVAQVEILPSACNVETVNDYRLS